MDLLVDQRTPNRKSASDDFTAVKRIGEDDDPTSLVTIDDDLTRSSHPPAPPPRAVGELSPGTKIGDYIIEEKVGQGGMGSVYRSVHPVIGKYAAVKVLDLGAEQYNIERFLDEARVVNQIGHPNIVDVFAFGETPDGRSYLVMEWLKGESLRRRMDRASIPLPELCDIIRPLARALQAAHDKNVIHRDLKPDNVFLVDVPGEPAIVKLLDFGIARPSSTEHRVAKTATGAIVGTPLYIAPEQAKGREIDSAADVYALGGMLFEMLCRRPPFMADNAMEIVAKHLMEPPPRPSQYAAVPPALDDLVLAMLAKEPVERPMLAAVMKVTETVRDQPVTPLEDRATMTSAQTMTSARMMRPFESDVGIPPWRPPTPLPVPEAAFPDEVRTPFPMRPTSETGVTERSDRPTAIAGPMTEFVRSPSNRWKWMLPLGVIAAGAIAFAVTSALGGSSDLPTRTNNEPPPIAPAIVPEERPPAAKVEPAPPKPDEPKHVAKPDEAVAKPDEPRPSPTIAPPATAKPRPTTMRKPPQPQVRNNPPPKSKPPTTGSGTMSNTGDLLEPDTLRRK